MYNLIDVKANDLNQKHIVVLCQGDILGIRIAEFASKEAIHRAENFLFNHVERDELGHAKEFTRLGIAYAEIKSEQVRVEYHQHARQNIQRVRDVFGELASPMDRLRVLLDDLWSQGASLLNVAGEKCFVGVCRYLTPGIDLEPHIDNLTWTLPAHVSWQLQYQLSANIYLQVPDEGGELEIWKKQPNEEEYQHLQGERHYGISRTDISSPDLVIKPVARDLIIINPRFIHAVRPVSRVDRITLSAFIGVKSEQEPLIYWS
ncbi:Prolyl 4-hydroxylase, alpha subunit [Xenorhabdus bovienii str. puntauvense]|uniref:Prolyl 4-hydroxylase, alpha subunit n=1 Tax=Xenorhabdus bovienii str. puntauvense TaxID=1398201 RepID=A0A077NGB4_XENBV|nr:2OG-Fe(II) oxygenase [Xenorhabdus bovienii]CDG96850.1 Prolyl 4-hydroxylase, alpha subunit [Xenorhabdus bovienii str. puntauvense]